MAGKHFGFRELRGCFPISSKSIGGIVNLVALKYKQVQCRKAVDNIAPKILGTKNAEIRSHMP